MADIRFDNMFWSPGGFNIQSGEPIDSRMYVADINHIYSAENWKKVKPYPGLIVSAPDGEVRICVNSDYTLESSWKKIGGGAVSVATYAEAVALATQDNIGQVIYVSSESEYEDQQYGAAPYIVTGNAALMKLAASSASGDVTSDIAGLQSSVGKLQSDITRIDGEIANKANKTDVETSISDLRVEIGNTYLTKESARTTYLSKTDASSTYVKKTDYDTKVEEIETTTSGLRTDVDALKSTVGVEASGETLATGLFKKIEDLKKDITAIPKFAIEVVETLPENNISGTTVYLVKEKESAGDLYTEYIYVGSDWENLGKQTVDLSSYATTADMNKAISDAISALKIDDYYKKTEVDGLLNDKADATDLENYVSNVTFDEYKTSVTQTLNNYVTNTTFTDYQGTVTTALATKLEQSALNDYVTSEALSNTLANYVTSESLTTKLTDYATKTALSDGLATKADKSSLDSYVLKTAIEGSKSISYVNDKLEITSITEQDLEGIMHPVTE